LAHLYDDSAMLFCHVLFHLSNILSFRPFQEKINDERSPIASGYERYRRTAPFLDAKSPNLRKLHSQKSPQSGLHDHEGTG
jgi:hypothetical protein